MCDLFEWCQTTRNRTCTSQASTVGARHDKVEPSSIAISRPAGSASPARARSRSPASQRQGDVRSAASPNQLAPYGFLRRRRSIGSEVSGAPAGDSAKDQGGANVRRSRRATSRRCGEATNPRCPLAARAARCAMRCAALELFVVSENVISNDTVDAGRMCGCRPPPGAEKDGTSQIRSGRITRQRDLRCGEAKPDWWISPRWRAAWVSRCLRLR